MVINPAHLAYASSTISPKTASRGVGVDFKARPWVYQCRAAGQILIPIFAAQGPGESVPLCPSCPCAPLLPSKTTGEMAKESCWRMQAAMQVFISIGLLTHWKLNHFCKSGTVCQERPRNTHTKFPKFKEIMPAHNKGLICVSHGQGNIFSMGCMPVPHNCF